MSSLTIVSYRLPVRFSVKNGKLAMKRSTGGLATALASYFEREGHGPLPGHARWIGIGDLPAEKFRQAAGGTTVIEQGLTLQPVFLATREGDLFYNGFCNAVLWPLFHYFPSFVVYDESYFEAYHKANQAVADAIVASYRPGEVIWIHDYHFLLLPSLLRKRLPEATIGFFLHIPFPSFELFRILPRRWQREIMNGLMGANVVGFHTADYVDHFADSLKRILDMEARVGTVMYEGRHVRLGCFPISIDVEKFSRMAGSSAIQREVKRIRERFNQSTLLLSVDRLDYTKAIINRLESFETFLRQHRNLLGKVTYILLLVPTRDGILRYRENKLLVETLISQINGMFGTLTWTPIIYQYRSLEFPKLVALYSACHVALITPVRDGMNLVAKEFVAARADSDGVLILSETTGCASELQQAIIVNANDRTEIAEAIFEAVNQPPHEQHRRIASMQEHLKGNDVHKWMADFLRQLLPAEEVRS